MSKLIWRDRGLPTTLPTVDEFLDGIEHSNLGGTCYACATHFNALLRHLGYDARLCGAAMSRPDVHVVNVIRFGEEDSLVDVGYGAPLFAPLPLDTIVPISIRLGRDRYILNPRDERGRSRLDHLRDEQVVHGYTVTPIARQPEYFQPEIARSFRPEAEFLRRLRIVLHRPERSIFLHDFAVTIVENQAVRAYTLPDREMLSKEIERLFQIPPGLTDVALSVLGENLG